MSALLGVLRKDLRRAAPGLLAWFVLQLTANVSVLLLRGHAGSEGLAQTLSVVCSAGLVMVNAVVAFLFASRLVYEDPPDRAGGSWRLLPLGPTQVFLAKLLGALLCATLPTLAALLPVALASGWSAELVLRSLVLTGAVCAGVAMVGLGYSVFAFRHPASVGIQLLSALLSLALAMTLVVRAAAQGNDWNIPSRLLVALTVLSVGMPFACWLYYRTVRRLPAIAALLATLGAASLALAFWNHRTLDFLFYRERALACAPLTTEISEAGARRVTQVLDLPANQWFDSFPPWYLGNPALGEMWLGGRREPAQFALVAAARPGKNLVLLDPVKAQQLTPQPASVRFLLPGRQVAGLMGDLAVLQGAVPDKDSLTWRLEPVLPAPRVQEYLRPGFSARVQGYVYERRVCLRVPLGQGNEGRGEGEQLRILAITRQPDGALRVEAERTFISSSLWSRDSFLVDSATGKSWRLERSTGVKEVPLGFVSAQREHLTLSPQVPALGGGSPAWEGLSYVELGDVQLGPAFVALEQEEVREQVPAFNEDQVQRFSRVRDEVDRRRKVREERLRRGN